MKDDQSIQKKLGRKKHEKELYKLQVEISKLQAWIASISNRPFVPEVY